MRAILMSLVLAVVALMTSCSTVSVNYDYDPQYNFGALKTYDWLAAPEKAKSDELLVKQIRYAVDKVVQAKGLRFSPERPDFLIALHSGTEKRVDVQDWGYTYGRYGYYNAPVGGSPFWRKQPLFVAPGTDYYEYRRGGADTYEYEISTIMLDFVDAKTRELIWRGTAAGVVDPSGNPAEREKKMLEVVSKILENFPPPAGSGSK